MLRARQTGQPLADALGMDAQVIDDLAEIDQDANEYVPMEELKAEGGEAWQAILDDPTVGEQASSLHRDAEAMLGRMAGEDRVKPRGIVGLFPANADGDDIRVDGAITVEVFATDWNCPKYITPRYTAEQVAQAVSSSATQFDR